MRNSACRRVVNPVRRRWNMADVSVNMSDCSLSTQRPNVSATLASCCFLLPPLYKSSIFLLLGGSSGIFRHQTSRRVHQLLAHLFFLFFFFFTACCLTLDREPTLGLSEENSWLQQLAVLEICFLPPKFLFFFF